MSDERLYTRSDGRPLGLMHPLARGGEGTIWAIDRPGLLAKLHHTMTPMLLDKLEIIVAAAPEDGRRDLGVPAVAWPRDLVVDGAGAVRGFVMARVRSDITLLHVAVPRLRRRVAPHLSWYGLHGIAAALARAVALVHSVGVVVGDLRGENALVDASGAVTLIDTDSVQIPVPGGVLPCPVGSEGLTPPELIDHDFGAVARTPHHDAFGLAVLIHMLLLGHHPFQGVWRDSGEPPVIDALVKRGLWPLLPEHPIDPPPGVPPFAALGPRLQALFVRAFRDGARTPAARPGPEEWEAALAEALPRLEPCLTNEHHVVDRAAAACPWCALQAETGVDLFPPPPSGSALGSGDALGRHDPPLAHRRLERALRLGDEVMAGRLWNRLPDLHQHPEITPETAALAARAASRLERLERLAAAARRPGTPSASLAALWDEDLATHALAAEPSVDGLPLAEVGRRAKRRTAALAALDRALTAEPPPACSDAWAAAEAEFPAGHWELRERRPRR